MRKKGKIGLALGSGSARGWAHIGVLRELQAMGIPIHAVAGCSIGALVGGVYALGKLDELEAWACSLTIRHMAMMLMDPQWGMGGIVRGDRVFRILKSFQFDGQIEDLPLPFGAVATDMQTGEEVWLRTGSLLDAIRSSAALPGLVKPHRHNNQWLFDGALVNPVPIALARSLGCDHVIAVNLNHDLLTPPTPAQRNKASTLSQLIASTRSWLPSQVVDFGEWVATFGFENEGPIDESELESPLKGSADELGEFDSEHPGYRRVIWSMMNIMQDRITRYRMRLDAPEIEIKPELSHLSLLEFHSAKASIQEGRRAVQQQEKALVELVKEAESTPPLESPTY